MATKRKVTYPVTKETIHAYAKSIFDPIKRGECVTTVWVPMAGRRMWNKFLIENIDLFRKELPGHKKYFLIYIEPLDLTEESIAGYLRLMGKSFVEACRTNDQYKNGTEFEEMMGVFDDDKASYSKLLDHLKRMLRDVLAQGFEVVFFLGEFDELSFATPVLFNNLKSLWSGLYPKLHYVFLMRERVTRPENISLWGELNEVILQNLVYVPLLSGKDFDYLVTKFSKDFSVSVSKKEVDVLRGVCGGHPFLLKVAVRVLANNRSEIKNVAELKELLLGYYELQSVARGILAVRSEEEKQVLRMIAETGKTDGASKKEISDLMIKLKLASSRKGKYKLFGALFENAVIASREKETTRIETDNGGLTLGEDGEVILFNGESVEEKFTRQEYALLRMFLQNKGKLATRDDIGDVLWGEQAYEKYSDWAIDQIMSKIRRKLKDMTTGSRLATVRGRGYKLVAS